MPVERAEIVLLLRTRDFGVGIGGVIFASANAGNTGVQIGGEEETVKVCIGRGFADCFAFVCAREYGVGDGRMSGRQHAARLGGKQRIDLGGDLGGIGIRWQSVGFGFAEQAFADDIAAQQDCAGERRDLGA